MKQFYIAVAAILVAIHGGVAVGEDNVIRIKGSDTLFVVAHAWAEAYDEVKPEVTVSVGGGGSGAGFAALLTGMVDIANASRAIGVVELERAQDLEMEIKEYVVGYDAVVVYLHKANPVKQLSFPQLERMFGRDATLRHWSDLDVRVPGCRGQEIVRVGRQNSSGTYTYFRDTILTHSRAFDMDILHMLTSKDVVHVVEKTPCAIGYSGLAYATPKVELACIAKDSRSPCVMPSIASTSDGSYPIARPLFMYTRDSANPAVKKYMDWILGDAGQCVLLKKGYAPVRPVECN